VAADSAGNVYVADSGNHVIRRIANDAQHTVTTIAGTGSPGLGEGPGMQAALDTPQAIAVAADGTLYVADTRNNRIVRIARDAPHNVSSWAGSPSGRSGKVDGNGTAAKFFFPMGITAAGGDLYVADTRNSRIRRIDAGRNVTTVVGAAGQGLADGSGASARIKWPTGIAAAGGAIYFVETGNRRIRRVALDGVYTTRTLAGAGIGGFADGPAASALLMPWNGIAAVGTDVFVGDTGNSRIRVLRASRVSTFAGDGRVASTDGAGPASSFALPMGLAVLPSGTLVVADEGSSTIRLVGAGVVSGGGGGSGDAGPPPDAGPPDAGPPDAGPPDAGTADAGTGPRPPNAVMTGGPLTGRAPLRVYLDATASKSGNPGGWISRFQWDLGDGTTSTAGFLYKTYPVAGQYRVVVEVFDEGGRVSTAEKVITVSP
jgi:sugar lactone lactonase YvrE